MGRHVVAPGRLRGTPPCSGTLKASRSLPLSVSPSVSLFLSLPPSVCVCLSAYLSLSLSLSVSLCSHLGRSAGPGGGPRRRRRRGAPACRAPARSPARLPGPETTIFGGQAPCLPIQTHHSNPIHCGTREGRVTAPRGNGQEVFSSKSAETMYLSMRASSPSPAPGSRGASVSRLST